MKASGFPFAVYVIPTVVGKELRLAYVNAGPGGMFQASARVVSFTGNSYPQKVMEYPMFWDCEGGGSTCRIGHDLTGVLIVAESVQRTIQDPALTMGLVGSDGAKSRIAVLNDPTATWQLRVIVWRLGWGWLLRDTYQMSVHRGSFGT